MCRDNEEEEERVRQLHDRWAYFERNMRAGVKCRERVEFETELFRVEQEKIKALLLIPNKYTSGLPSYRPRVASSNI